MDARELEAFRQVLLRQRQRLFDEVESVEANLQVISEDRESELEEAAQSERQARLLSRLDDRSKAELQEIERALYRIATGRYGTCEGCAAAIVSGRLAAVPATPYCRDCAARVECGEPVEAEETAGTRVGVVPPDYTLVTDRELEEAVREQVREDGRVDTDELRVVCRHGVVYLDGVLPSEGEHSIVRQTVTDIMGLREVIDRLQIKEILWEREDRDKPQGAAPEPWEEPESTEEVTEAEESGTAFVAPSRPRPDET